MYGTSPVFDIRDREILDSRQKIWDINNPKVNGPRIGDFVLMENDTLRRFCHDWGDSLQITSSEKSGSFYLGAGYVNYSGSLEPSIPKAKFQITRRKRDGRFWFFHHAYRAAHNGVYFNIPCRVYRYIGD